MKFSSASLLASLETHVPLAATGLAVALSGGADSASLLTAAASLGPSFRNLPLRAVHVDHGLQAAAAEFRTACAALCRRLNIALTVIPVKVDTGAGASVEAAARGARYAVLASDLRPGECLLTAHHREDQAETLLLQALRGAGLKGMSAMPVCTPFGLGWHVRPVLDVAHRELLEFGAGAAAARGFIAVRGFTVADGPAAVDGPAMAGGPAVPDESTAPGGPAVPDESTAPGGPAASDEPTVADGSAAAGGNAAFDEPGSAADPMNEDLRFDRVYLRRRVWPLIESRWPGAAIALSRAAAHAAEAQELLDAVAAADVQRLRDGEALSVPGLRSLPPPQRINAVRYWLSGAGADAPSAARIAEALRQMLDAAADHLPAVVWGAHALRRYRQRLFLTPAQPPRLQGTRSWRVQHGSGIDLGPELGNLRWVAHGGGVAIERLPDTVLVRARRGGETLRRAPEARTQSVQHLCQSFGVLPWLRDALPLVFAGDALIAVADLWLETRWCAAPGADGLRVVWEKAPIIV